MKQTLIDHIRHRLETSEQAGEYMRQQNLWMILGQIELALMVGELNSQEAAELEERTGALIPTSTTAPANSSALALGNAMTQELLVLLKQTAALYEGGKIRGRSHRARQILSSITAAAKRFQPLGPATGPRGLE